MLCSPDNRNRPGENFDDMLLFNDVIQHIDLAEISCPGRSYTWSSMQLEPPLEKLDWVFTSSSWSSSFPYTSLQVLSMPVSDHSPFVVSTGTHVLR